MSQLIRLYDLDEGTVATINFVMVPDGMTDESITAALEGTDIGFEHIRVSYMSGEEELRAEVSAGWRK
jgi:hypothetical protein